MPTITPTHRLANKAVLSVCTILDQAGALSETIKNDYGEDLLVQTHLKDNADNFHILIQVKGTHLKIHKNGWHVFRVDVEHLIRWVSHTQPVIVCIFDNNTENVFSFYPRDVFSLWELKTTRKKTLTIKLLDNDKFDKSSAIKRIWDCRVEYFSRMLSWHESLHYYQIDSANLKKSQRAIQREGNVIVHSFLNALDIFHGDEFCREFMKKIESASINFAKTNLDHPDDPLSIRHVFGLCLLGRIDDIAPGVGLPGNFLEHGAYILNEFFRRFHPEEWARANQLLGDKPCSRRKRVASERPPSRLALD